MRRILFSVLVLAATPAFAFDLSGLLSGFSNIACNQTVTTLAGGNLCRLVKTANNGYDFGNLLKSSGLNLVTAAINGLTGGATQGLQQLLGPVDSFFGTMADGLEQGLSLPQRFLDQLTGEVYKQTYAAGLSLLTLDSGAVSSIQNTLKPDSISIGLSVTVDSVGQSILDSVSANVSQYNSSAPIEASQMVSALSVTAANQDQAVAQQKAEEAAAQAREQAQKAVIETQLGAQARRAADAAAAGAKVTDSASGLAQSYRDQAKNAPSDRALLELQVNALADIMDQQATYMPILAQLIAGLSQTQALTTEALKTQAQQAAQEVIPSGKEVAESTARAVDYAKQQMSAQMSPLLSAMDAVCTIYNGGQSCSK